MNVTRFVRLDNLDYNTLMTCFFVIIFVCVIPPALTHTSLYCTSNILFIPTRTGGGDFLIKLTGARWPEF